MVVRNRVSRYHPVMHAGASDLMAYCRARLADHATYMVANLADLPDLRDWALAHRTPPG
jgi:xylulose-5-phosphate/fructose-6-phosphate phosphoketolase